MKTKEESMIKRVIFSVVLLAGLVHGNEEKAALAMVKEQLAVAEKNVRIMQQCIQGANTLAQANACEKAFAQASNDTSEPFTAWDAALKKELLEEVKYYLDVIAPCVNKAKTLEELSVCVPDEG
jgi:hypothetical protein